VLAIGSSEFADGTRRAARASEAETTFCLDRPSNPNRQPRPVRQAPSNRLPTRPGVDGLDANLVPSPDVVATAVFVFQPPAAPAPRLQTLPKFGAVAHENAHDDGASGTLAIVAFRLTRYVVQLPDDELCFDPTRTISKLVFLATSPDGMNVPEFQN
jgi:hypothetical protein